MRDAPNEVTLLCILYFCFMKRHLLSSPKTSYVLSYSTTVETYFLVNFFLIRNVKNIINNLKAVTMPPLAESTLPSPTVLIELALPNYFVCHV